MDDLSITSLLSKYQNQQPKNFGDYVERQYPVSAIIEIIRELKNLDRSIKNDDGWISTEKEDNAPNYMQKVLIQDILGDIYTAKYTGIKDIYTVNNELKFAVYWQPLPTRKIK